MSCLNGCFCKLICGTHVKTAGKQITSRQSKPLTDGRFVDDKDENGLPVRIYEAPSAQCSLPLTNVSKMKKDKNLLYSLGPETLYEAVMGHDNFANDKAYGACTSPHVFKDAEKDGKPNPKPVILEKPGQWEWLTYGDVRKRATAFGSCLRSKFKLVQGEKIAIWAGNSTDWMVTDLACHAYNWTSVSVYDTLGPNAASYICADSGAKVLVVEGKTFKKVPDLLKDSIYEDNPGKDIQVVVCIGVRFVGIDCSDEVAKATKSLLEAKGIQVIGFDDAVNEFMGKPLPHTPPKTSDLATIMYTSGTTGMPKGVKLTHRNVVSTIAALNVMPGGGLFNTDVHLSYLPLAHIFEREIEYGLLSAGSSIAFASNGAKMLLPDLSVIKPTMFAGVPKVYENVRDTVVRKMTGVKKTLFEAAMAGKKAAIETGCSYNRLWDILVFSKTKAALGGRVRFCVSGGAPISKDTLQFVLCALGPVVQGYGATETAAGSCVCVIGDMTLGHVGPPMAHSSIKLVDVPEMNYFAGKQEEYEANAKGGHACKAFKANKVKSGGEVWISGHGVSPGYWDPSVDSLKSGLPSNGMGKKSEEDFFKLDGLMTFRTGDIASWNEQGCLKIVDRRKNMFKTSLGEYVPVEEVEKIYQDTVPYVDFVFLPKETKVAYVALCCIVSDSMSTVREWSKRYPKFSAASNSEVCGSSEFKVFLLELMKKSANEKKLQGFLQLRDVKNMHVEYKEIGYQEQWVEGVMCANGHVEQLLTATFKARRSQLDQYFAPVFKTIYPDRPSDHILP